MSPFTALINSTPSLNHFVRATEPKGKCPAMTILVISFIFLCLFESSLSAPGRSFCPDFEPPAECPESVEHFCDEDAGCPTDLMCCHTGCERDCVVPDWYPNYGPVVTTVPPICSSPVDVAFIVDSSGSIGRKNFLKQKKFVKEVASKVSLLAPGQSRAAIVLYSNSASVKARFGQYATTEEFNRAVDSLPWVRGYTNIDRGLEVAATEVFPEGRKDLPKIALLITDGTQTKAAGAKGLMEASEPLRKAGVRVLVVGVGRRVDKDELRLVTESDDDVMLPRDFDDLLRKVGDVTRKVCGLSVSPTRSDVCPSFEPPAECPEQIENFCEDDVHCPSGLKCCNTGCELDCVVPH